jgi:hypothetical protein
MIYQPATSSLPYFGDEPAALSGFAARIQDARAELARLADGFDDVARDLSSCWSSAAATAANAEIAAQRESIRRVIAGLDEAVRRVHEHRRAVLAELSAVDDLRVLWTANLRDWVVAFNTGRTADIVACEQRFEDIGADWRSCYERLKRAAAATETQMLAIARGSEGEQPGRGLRVSAGLEELVFDERARGAGSATIARLTPTSAQFLSEQGSEFESSFPVGAYRAAVSAAALKDPAGFGQFAAHRFAQCTDYVCVLQAAEDYRALTTLVALAAPSADQLNGVIRSILDTVQAVTVGDCFDGTLVDCVPLIPVTKSGRVLGYVKQEPGGDPNGTK